MDDIEDFEEDYEENTKDDTMALLKLKMDNGELNIEEQEDPDIKRTLKVITKGGGMNQFPEDVLQSQINPDVKKLEKLLSKFVNPKKADPFTNFTNVRKSGGMYVIPFNTLNACRQKSAYLYNETVEPGCLNITAVDKFFEYVERCRINGIIGAYQEKQYFQLDVDKNNKKMYKTKTDYYEYSDESVDFSDSEITKMPSKSSRKNKSSKSSKSSKKSRKTKISHDTSDQDDQDDNVLDAGSEKENLEMSDVDLDISDQQSEQEQDEEEIEDVEDIEEGIQEDENDISESGEKEEAENMKGGIPVSGIYDFDKSGLFIDLDIYQRHQKRISDDFKLYSLVCRILEVVIEYVDIDKSLNRLGDIFIRVVALTRSEITASEYKGEACFKDGVHLLIPEIKISKNLKKFVFRKIVDRGILQEVYKGEEIINPFEEVFDVNSAHVPVELFGNSRNGRKPYELFKCYKLQIRKTSIVQFYRVEGDELGLNEPLKMIKVQDMNDRRKKILKQVPHRYKYNLTHEFSLIYNAPGGLFDKVEYDVREEFADEVRIYGEHSENKPGNDLELKMVKSAVDELIGRDHKAKYLCKILGILSRERAKKYHTWRDVLYILASLSPDYKPLAVWFSMRHREAWEKNGEFHLEKIWEHAISRQKKEGEKRSIGTLFYWAKKDNKEKYDKLQKSNTFTVLKNLALMHQGKLNDTDMAIILFTMFPDKFISDNINETDKKNWYELVLPGEDNGLVKGHVWKYRLEGTGSPDNLRLYISDNNRLPKLIGELIDWLDDERKRKETQEDLQRWYGKLRVNLLETVRKLGNARQASGIIKQAELLFRKRGFERKLDTDPDVIGVGNGVLRLYPNIELIQRFHEIPITRFTDVDYVPLDMKNPYVKKVFNGVKMLFPDDEQDAFEFVLFYLASCLDKRKKNPILFIWLGEGQNGKSFLVDLHRNTLRVVNEGGYATPLPIALLTQGLPSAEKPNSALMAVKYARFCDFAESEEGDEMKIAFVKRLVSDALSGRDLNQKQESFEANCHFTVCTNKDIRIHGSDHGTWRRIKVYYFKKAFVTNPDPDNPMEVKEDRSFVESIAKEKPYRTAWFSILVHYYQRLRKEYGGDLSRIPCPTIDRETELYREEQDTISKFVNHMTMHVGKTNPVSGTRVEPVSDTDLAKEYIKWYRSKIGDKKFQISAVRRDLKRSSLKKYFRGSQTDKDLIEHVVFNLDDHQRERKKMIKAMKMAKGEPDADELSEDESSSKSKKSKSAKKSNKKKSSAKKNEDDELSEDVSEEKVTKVKNSNKKSSKHKKTTSSKHVEIKVTKVRNSKAISTKKVRVDDSENSEESSKPKSKKSKRSSSGSKKDTKKNFKKIREESEVGESEDEETMYDSE